MQSLRRFVSVSAIAAMLTLAACGGTRPYAALPIEDDAEMTTNVVVSTTGVQDDIRVGRAGVQRIDGSNQLKVLVPIRNISDHTVHIRVQTSFLNLEKQPIGDDTNQQVQILSPGMTINHVAVSKTDEARDWVMRIGENN